MPHPWKHSRSGWMWLGAIWCSGRCLCPSAGVLDQITFKSAFQPKLFDAYRMMLNLEICITCSTSTIESASRHRSNSAGAAVPKSNTMTMHCSWITPNICRLSLVNHSIRCLYSSIAPIRQSTKWRISSFLAVSFIQIRERRKLNIKTNNTNAAPSLAQLHV